MLLKIAHRYHTESGKRTGTQSSGATEEKLDLRCSDAPCETNLFADSVSGDANEVIPRAAETICRSASPPNEDFEDGDTPDGFPILGADPDVPNLVYATGHFRNGILLAPLTGERVGALLSRGEWGADVAGFGIGRFGTFPIPRT